MRTARVGDSGPSYLPGEGQPLATERTTMSGRGHRGIGAISRLIGDARASTEQSPDPASWRWVDGRIEGSHVRALAIDECPCRDITARSASTSACCGKIS